MNEKTFWDAVLADLQLNLSELNYKTWASTSYISEMTENTLTITCPNKFAKDQMNGKFLPIVQDSVDKISKKKMVIDFEVGDSKREAEQNKTALQGTPIFESIGASAQKKKNGKHFGLNPKYSFENYVIGSHNQLAFAVANAVSQNPGKQYNPLFIYSGAGLGKTHLMQAIGNKIAETQPELSIIYTTGEAFTNEFIEVIQQSKSASQKSSFKKKYREADLLLIDDVQFIIGRESTQQEFFHTFNELFMKEKQIVLTSDKPPSEFTNLEERVKSRFGQGMIVDIQKPDLDMRVAILRAKRNASKENVSNEAIDAIASRVDTNVRELEGAYIRVLAQAMSDGVEASQINEDFVKHALNGIVKEKENKPINMNTVLKTVCSYYSVTMQDVKGKRRTQNLVVPRQISMYLMHELTHTPFLTIGEYLGGRDHTTVMHGVRKIEDQLNEDLRVEADVKNIKSLLFA